MYDDQELKLFSQLFFRTDELPSVCDYSQFLNQYANLLTLYLDVEDSSFYRDTRFLEIAIAGFAYCHDFYFSEDYTIDDDTDYFSFAVDMVSQIEDLKEKRNESYKLSEDEMVSVLSMKCATDFLGTVGKDESDSNSSSENTDSSITIIQGVVNNMYRVYSVMNKVHSSDQRSM